MTKILKLLAFAVWLIFFHPLNVAAQTIQYATCFTTNVNNSVNVPLQTNQLLSVVASSGSVFAYGNTPDGTRITLPLPSTGPFQTFTGLTNAYLQGVNSTAFVTFQITTPTSANIVSNYVPADAIVIPASATGNVQIILESSPDLVNWTAANPGTYSAGSATNRFFRVRAAVQN